MPLAPKPTRHPGGFPILTSAPRGTPTPRIPWHIAERAHQAYVKRYGNIQSIEQIASRGGFSPSEMDQFHPPWRNEYRQHIAAQQSGKIAEEASKPPRRIQTFDDAEHEQPVVINAYHATSNYNAERIRREGFKVGQEVEANGFLPHMEQRLGRKHLLGDGVYFADEQRKKHYGTAGYGNLHKVEVTLNKPYVLPHRTTWDTLKRINPDELKAQGYDGIIVKSGQYGLRGGENYRQGVVFHPHQIRIVDKHEPIRELAPYATVRHKETGEKGLVHAVREVPAAHREWAAANRPDAEPPPSHWVTVRWKGSKKLGTKPRTDHNVRGHQVEVVESIEESLQGVYLANPRTVGRPASTMVFDIMHPEHGHVGHLEGVVQDLGKSGKRSFNVHGIGLDHSAIRRIRGLDSTAPYSEVRDLAAHTLGPAAVRGLLRQLRQKTGVSAVHSDSRMSGMRAASAVRNDKPFLMAVVPPRRIREVADELITAALNEIAKPKRARFRPFRCSCGHSWVDEDTPSGRACHSCQGGKGKPFVGESTGQLVKAALDEIAKPRRVRFSSMRPSPEVPEALRAMDFYHGVDNDAAAHGILAAGRLEPATYGHSTFHRGYSAPRPDKVYLTKDATHAAERALSGTRLGSDTEEPYLKTGRHGYIFKVAGSDLNNVEADEDNIERAYWNTHGGGEHDFPGLGVHHGVADLGKRVLSQKDHDTLMGGGSFNRRVRVAKKLAGHMTPDMHHDLVLTQNAHIAHGGPVRIVGAWRIDKTRNDEFHWDGSDLFQKAEPLHHLIGKGLK